MPNLVSNIIYDARGNQTNVTRPNGVSTVMGWSTERGWLTSLVTSGTAGTVQDLTYTRDELGRITGVASPLAGDGWAYGYDDLDRLLSADNTTDDTLDQSFTYDLVGNMLTNSKVGTYAYPAQGSASVRPHAVTGISGGPLGAQSFTYDANGSMTVQGPDTRAYDGENRLVSATDGGATTQFVYGPDGARLKKIAGGATTLYFGDDVEVTPGATPVYTKYLPGDAKRVDLGAITWLHRDHLQSVRALTSAAGAILDRATYRPFGEQQGFATVAESKGYIGQRNDTETGLMYLHARYYDPVLARFVQADPMDPYVVGVGLNRYAYAFNNPVMMLDPSGLRSGDNDRYGGRNARDTEHAQNDSGGGGGYSNVGGDYECDKCAHKAIGALIDGRRTFFRDTRARLVASLSDAGAFNADWSVVAQPIAQKFRTLERAVRDALSKQRAEAATATDVAPKSTLGRPSPGVGGVAIFLGLLEVSAILLAQTSDQVVQGLVNKAAKISAALNNEYAQRNQVIAVVFADNGHFYAMGGAATPLTRGQQIIASIEGIVSLTNADAVSSLDYHAEIQVLDAVTGAGLEPLALGSSHPFCEACAPSIENDYGDGYLVGPAGSEQGAVWPDHWKSFY